MGEVKEVDFGQKSVLRKLEDILKERAAEAEDLRIKHEAEEEEIKQNAALPGFYTPWEADILAKELIAKVQEIDEVHYADLYRAALRLSYQKIAAIQAKIDNKLAEQVKTHNEKLKTISSDLAAKYEIKIADLLASDPQAILDFDLDEITQDEKVKPEVSDNE